MHGGENSKTREITGVDELLHRHRGDELLVVGAQAARPRRRAQTDERHVGPFGREHPMAIEVEPLMGLVNEHEIGWWQLATHQRLYRSHQHQPVAVRHPVVCLDDTDVAHALSMELLERLIDELNRRDREEDRSLDIPASADHCAGDARFACAGWQLQHDPPRAIGIRVAHANDCGSLIRSKRRAGRANVRSNGVGQILRALPIDSAASRYRWRYPHRVILTQALAFICGRSWGPLIGTRRALTKFLQLRRVGLRMD
jgi:hypothetical protein